MVISQVLAWVSALLCALEVLRYPARASRAKGLNRAFHKIHIPLGVLLLLTGCLHGLLAGNLPAAALGDAELAPVLFTANWGTACFLCAALLAASCLPRRRLGKRWLPLHRALTVLMIVLLAAHLTDVGIHLPDRWAGPPAGKSPVLMESAAPAPAPTPRVTPAPTSKATPTAAPTEEAASTPEPTAEPTPTPEPTPEPGLPDGVYTGTGQGRNGPITVSVTVSAGEIAGIEVTGHGETPRYFSSAKGVIDSILSAQSTEVDAITGATISSEGIKAAVADALGRQSGAIEAKP